MTHLASAECLKSETGWVVRFGYRVTSVNSESTVTGELRTARLLRRFAALTPQPVVQVMWMSTEGGVEVRLAFSAIVLDRETALQVGRELPRLVEASLRELRPDWTLGRVSELRPALDAPLGELRRPDVTVSLADGVLSMPTPAACDPGSHASVVRHLARAPRGTALVIAAEPVDELGFEQADLRDALTRMEAGLQSSEWGREREKRTQPYPSSPAYEIGIAARGVASRLDTIATTYNLRASLVGTQPADALLIASVCTAFGGLERCALWVPAAESNDITTARSNVAYGGFEPWAVGRPTTAGATPMTYASSLAEVLAWLTLPECAGLPQLELQHISPSARPTPSAAARMGARLGASAFDPSRAVALDESSRDRHVYALGRTGTGKTTLLVNLALDDIDAGHGICFLDPHGDPSDDLIAALPRRHRDRVIVINPTSPTTATLNPFALHHGEDADVTIDELAAMFIRLWDPAGGGEIIGPRWLRYFDAAARTLIATPGGSLAHVDRLFLDEEYRNGCLFWVEDEETKRFWTHEITSDRQASEIIPWFTCKFRPFSTNRLMRRIVASREPGLDAGALMDEGGILIARLPKGELGSMNSSILGTLVMMRIQAAALARSSVSRSARKPYSVLVDECQAFATAGMETLIAEGRKYGMRLVLANQNVDQLSPRLRRTILGNVGTLIAFRLGISDAHDLESEFAPHFDAWDLSRLQTGRAVVKTTFEDGSSGVFDVRTPEPAVAVAEDVEHPVTVPGPPVLTEDRGHDLVPQPPSAYPVQLTLPEVG